MAKIYLAATYDRHPELQVYAQQLIDLGHEITARWIWGEHAAQDGDIMGSGNAEFAGRMAMEDEQDIWNCDLFIHFTEPPETNARRGGAHVEMGIARALGKRIMLVGYYTNIFHRLPDVYMKVGLGRKLHAPQFFETWDEALTAIRGENINDS